MSSVLHPGAEPARTVGFRIPARLQQQIEDIARRDVATLSGTIRRLITIGLRAEQRQAQDERRHA